ncbi:MAG: DNA translocase FtsK, partial [Firmicutes bacterium]|nr:DNA translocase FtsK [Bacillota bacterium]
GKGDMLYNPLGMGKPLRVQGAYVSDEEVHKVIEFIKEQSTVTYADEVLDTIENSSASGGGAGGADDGDELLADAIELVVHSGQASVSMLQRRFRIGYNRAARIIDMMEARGIVGPPDGSRPRQVLMTEVDLYALKGDTEDIEEEL